MTRPRLLNDPHARTPDEVMAALDTDREGGLSGAEAAARLARDGANTIAGPPPVPVWRRWLAQFQETLVVLLLIATAISAAVWYFDRDTALPYEALAIGAVLLINAVMGFVQEARAESAVQALRHLSAARARAVRDGVVSDLAAADLVVGDLLVLGEGDTVPADARLVECVSLHTSEAALTGESQPVPKATAPVAADATTGDRRGMVWSGTVVTYGHGRAVVVATGTRTEMGHIAGMLGSVPEEDTPLQRELDRVGTVLGLGVGAIAVVMIATILLTSEVTGVSAVVDALILGVALAVAAVPEGLPAIVTAVLAIGVQRMARRHAIVRHMRAVETLGSADVIASDKTGTLTRNEMTVRVVATASGRAIFSGTGYDPRGTVTGGAGPVDQAVSVEVSRVLMAGDRANNASLHQSDGRWVAQGDPTEVALLVAARKFGIDPSRAGERFPRTGEVPFSSERRLMTTVHIDRSARDERVVFVKGAPDVVLRLCTHEGTAAGPRPLDDSRRQAILAVNEQMAQGALRTLAMASRRVPPGREGVDHTGQALEHDLVFDGLVGMIDPPRDEARDAVARARQAGIRVLMITGDHPATAAVIARDLGMTGDGEAVTGATIEEASDEALAGLVARQSVFARVVPHHKLRIVRALQQQGAVVAMTGDGVNDAPALKTADIGVAMGVTGTDVSKEASDMILVDDNFASIVAAVEEGRAIFDNIRKFLRYLLSSNIGEVLTMFLGLLLAPVIGLRDEGAAFALPLLATQLLWINLVTDGAPALALGIDPASPGLMDRPPRSKAEGVITARMWRGIAFVGLVMAAGTLLVLDASLPGGLIEGTGDIRRGQTMAFTTLTMFQLFNVFNARSDDASAFSTVRANPWLWAGIGLSLALHAAVIYVPFLQHAFSTTALAPADWALAAVVGSSVLWLREIGKWIARRSTARDVSPVE